MLKLNKSATELIEPGGRAERWRPRFGEPTEKQRLPAGASRGGQRAVDRTLAAMDPSDVTAVRLYGEIAGPSVEAKPNFVFSPLSIFSVFHSAQQGAAGETKAQMDALVGPKEKFQLPKLMQPRNQEGAVVADVANRVYAHPELEQNKMFHKYQKILTKEGSVAQTLDFADAEAAAEAINSFVAQATHDHIKDLVSAAALGPQTRLVLVNALYFKAPWQEQFDPETTVKDTFNTPSGPKTVSFMKGKLEKKPLLVSLRQGLVSVGLPYKDNRLRLYIFMPDDLVTFEKEMVENPDMLESVIADMELSGTERAYEEELFLTLPKFKLSAAQNKVDLLELFARLGASDMFMKGKADFSGITGDRDLYVSSYVHQADIDVNEEGTEATAATAMIVMLRAMFAPKTPVHVTINKPFVFQLRFLHGETDLLLFSGRIADPSTAQ
ncbi:hypothetical protein Esti_001428 [Eimeria stiedai]